MHYCTFVVLVILANFGGTRGHAKDYDCRPCELGWQQTAACEPQAHSTMCEKCLVVSVSGDERSSSEYAQYCLPIENKCDLQCPVDQFRVEDCLLESSKPHFISCLWCNKASASEKTLPDYVRQCVPTTTAPATTTLAGGVNNHSMSAHDIAHGHGQAAAGDQTGVDQLTSVAPAPAPTTTTPEEDVVYEDSGNQHGGGEEKTTTTATAVAPGGDEGANGAGGTGTGGTGDEGNTVSDQDANAGKTTVAPVGDGGANGAGSGGTGGTGGAGNLALDQDANAGAGAGAGAATVAVGAVAGNENEGSPSHVHKWINYVVIAIIFLAILLIILAVVIWRCRKKRKQVPKSDTMTQPIMMSESVNGHLLADTEVIESPVVKVQTSAQHAAPPSHALAPKKKIWGSRDFPWIDEDIKEPFA